MIQENITTDVLVIGAGGAGIRAALAASEAGVNVVLVTKGKATRSGSTFSSLSKGWGIQALVGEERTHKGLEEFYNDIISVGLGLCDPKLVKILVEESGLCLEELISFGLNFRKDPEGSYLRIGGCFSDVKRAFVTESLANIRETFNAMLKRSGAEIINGAVIDLITHENSCCGAWVLNGKNEPLRINARATIMASGGGGALYRYNLVTGGATGDGYALAHRAGARLVNMEFIQFMLGTHNGKGCRFFPLSEIMGRKPLLDENGNDILKACLPDPAERKESLQDRLRHYPFSCRDSSSTVDITVAEKMKKGEKVLWKDPGRAGALSEVIHCAHAFNGGIKIDKNAESTLPGLFAAGEVAGGPQGADRVGGV